MLTLSQWKQMQTCLPPLKDPHNSFTNWLNNKSYYNRTISLLSQRMKEAEIQGLLWWDLMQQIQSIRWSIEENQIRPVKDLLPSMFYCCWTKVLFKVSLYGWRLRTLDGGNSQTKMRHNCCMNTIHSNLTETNFKCKLWYIFNSIIGHFLDLTSLDRGQAWRHLVEAWELGWLPYKEFHRRPPLRPSTWSVRSGLHRAPGFFLINIES